MSILIKGMEMPTTGLYFVSVDETGGRDKTIVTVERMLGNRDVRHIVGSFELVPVPPHGRLIDADALASEMEKQISNQDELMELCKSAGDMKNYFNTSKVQIGMVSFLRALNDSHTIIPASDELPKMGRRMKGELNDSP